MTSIADPTGSSPVARVPSGIAGLDAILRGGFLQGGLYIVQGGPGAGKTIFGNQLCYNHVARGGHALYVTLLAESHDRIIHHMRSMAFFSDAAIASGLHYVSAFRMLEEDGLDGLVAMLRREIIARSTSVLILDGLVQAGETARNDTEFKKFIHALQSQAAFTGCTMFLLTSAKSPSVMPEHTMVDGLVELDDAYFGGRAERELTVTKFRGGAFLRGRHAFTISDRGVEVYPRLEALLEHPTSLGGADQGRATSGVPGLDAMIGGGFPAGSTTLLLGPPGSGKTTLGLQFLSEASSEAPGLLFGFYETPPRIVRKANDLAPKVSSLIQTGAIDILWHPPTERILDRLAHELLDTVRRRGTRRVFVDGLNGFTRVAARPERVPAFLSALSNELRALGVTTLFGFEAPELIGPMVRAPLTELTQIADNLMLLRYVEYRARLVRLISVMKLRDSAFDNRLRELILSESGIRLADGFDSAEAILTGFARETNNGDDGRTGASDRTHEP